MKRCPTCQRTYTDDSLTFCLEDGALLLREESSSALSESPTVIFSEPPDTSSNRGPAPTEVYNATPTQGGSAPGYTAAPPVWTPQPLAPQSFGQQPSWPGANAAPPNKLTLALLGGVVMALPSLIPLVQWVCCVWAAVGGALAAGLYIKKSPTKVEPGEGAILGAIAGGVGAAINLIVGLPIAYALYGARGPAATRDGSFGGVLMLVGIFGTMMLVAFATAGGLLAVQMFEKRRSGMSVPPPPPPSYGGPTGGYR